MCCHHLRLLFPLANISHQIYFQIMLSKYMCTAAVTIFAPCSPWQISHTKYILFSSAKFCWPNISFLFLHIFGALNLIYWPLLRDRMIYLGKIKEFHFPGTNPLVPRLFLMQPVRKQEGDKGAGSEESHFKEALVELSKTRAFPVLGSREILKFAADFRAISLSQTTTSLQ